MSLQKHDRRRWLRATCMLGILVPALISLTAAKAHASTIELITNGSFETGDFTGWTTVTTGNPFVPWVVSPAGDGSGFFPLTSPQDGSFDAWNGFDGEGPMEFALYQDVSLPTGPAMTLSWQERLQWDFQLTATATQPRTYSVSILDPTTNAVLATLYSFSTGTSLVIGDTGWQTHTADLSAFAGQTVRVFFFESIPEAFTGPGQAEFDAISITAVPEPGSLVLLAVGMLALRLRNRHNLASGSFLR